MRRLSIKVNISREALQRMYRGDPNFKPSAATLKKLGITITYNRRF